MGMRWNFICVLLLALAGCSIEMIDERSKTANEGGEVFGDSDANSAELPGETKPKVPSTDRQVKFSGFQPFDLSLINISSLGIEAKGKVLLPLTCIRLFQAGNINATCKTILKFQLR